MGAATVCAIVLCSCGSVGPKSIDEVGTVRVSIASVGRWSDYKDALQPTFVLTEEAALEQVVPVTQLEDRKRLHATAAGLRVALPTAAASSGDASALEVPSAAAGDRTAAGISALEPPAVAPSRTDPMMRYWAATALLQEVRLLNRYMQDAAVRRNYDAYVLRFNVGLMPRRRDLAIDAYVNLGFFVGEDRACAALRDGRTGGESCSLAEVLPLMVLDNLEAATQSLSNDQLSAFAVAMGGGLGKLGVSSNWGLTSEELKRVLGRDLNSLLMVTRLNSNTLRVRFGAANDASSGVVMVPRNHFVSAVIMVPRVEGPRALHVWSAVEFVDVKTGRSMPEKPAKKDNAEVALLVERYRAYGVQADDIEKAWQFVLLGDWSGFLRGFSRHRLDEHTAREIWLDVAQLQTGYSFDVLSVELPSAPNPRVFPPQAALLLDDGKETSKARLVGGAELRAEELCATLEIEPTSSGKRVAARKVTVTERGTVAEFEFPSLKAWGLTEPRLHVRTDVEPGSCWDFSGNNGPREQTYPVLERSVSSESAPANDATER